MLKDKTQFSWEGWLEQQLGRKDRIGQAFRKLRRTWISLFDPERVQQSIKESRQGECHRCGGCCELVYQCPFLGRDKDQLPYCRVYGELRPVNCRNYPFDALDSEVEGCGFTFKKAVREVDHQQSA